MLWRDRTLQTLTFAVPLILIGGLLPGRTAVRGLPVRHFWRTKMNWQRQFDFVVAGDSRVYRGVAPSILKDYFPGLRVANFGFSSAGYEPDYLRAVERLLDPESRQPIIVLGITPFALTPRAATDNEYRYYQTHPQDRRPRTLLAGRIEHFLRPYSFRALLDTVCGRTYHEVYNPDGWVASRQEPEDPRRAARAYAHAFDNNRIDPAMIEALLNAVRSWSRRGIHVYGVRVPTSGDIIRMENALSGFDEATLVRAFEEAGGHWLDFPDSYHSYDGSHLREDAARRFSQDLGLAIVRRLASSGTNPRAQQEPALP